jgi:GT2 family glycosyltransferase
VREPTISVVVPTHNRRERLGRLLAGLERQHHAGARFEVVVVVDGSTDDTASMLASLSPPYQLRTIVRAQGGPASARNTAMEAACGDVLLFLDDDVVPYDGLIERHLAVHRREPLAAVIGRMAPPETQRLPSWLDWEATLLERNYAGVVAGAAAPTWALFYTANVSVRRQHALAVGGFDERFKRGEDVEFGRRLAEHGLRFFFLPDAAVKHEPQHTLQQWVRAKFEEGRHRVLLEQPLGTAGIRDVQEDWRRRHVLTKVLVRWCVGHHERTRIVLGALGRLASSRFGSRRFRFFVCSALSNVAYWRGMAEGTGLGRDLWRRVIEPPASTVLLPALRSTDVAGGGSPLQDRQA